MYLSLELNFVMGMLIVVRILHNMLLILLWLLIATATKNSFHAEFFDVDCL